jgi:hypothetical protein
VPTASTADLDRSRGQALVLVVERDPHAQRLEQRGVAIASASEEVGA